MSVFHQHFGQYGYLRNSHLLFVTSNVASRCKNLNSIRKITFFGDWEVWFVGFHKIKYAQCKIWMFEWYVVKCFFLSFPVDCPDCSDDAYCNDDTNGQCVCTNGNDYDTIMGSCCTRKRKIHRILLCVALWVDPEGVRFRFRFFAQIQIGTPSTSKSLVSNPNYQDKNNKKIVLMLTSLSGWTPVISKSWVSSENGQPQFTYRQCLNLNLCEKSEFESEANTTHLYDNVNQYTDCWVPKRT